jgi:hypothetical protein
MDFEMPRWISLVGLLIATIPTVSPAAPILVVRSIDWADATADWIELRRAEGFEVVELEPASSAKATSERIQKVWKELPSSENSRPFIVLMGDVPESSRLDENVARPTTVPTFYVESKVVRQFGSEPTIATDHPYADWNADGIPEAVVGRIPAGSRECLARYLSRVIEYEQSKINASLLRKIDVVAGVGDFGLVADTVIEGVTRQLLTSDLPESYRLSMTQASSKSIFCPAPEAFQKSVLNRLNTGGLFWVYLGHGFIDTLDYLKFTNPQRPILDRHSIDQIAVRGMPPIAVILACYVGAYDAVVPSLAEQMILDVDGPIAVIAASRVTMPYAMGIFGDELLQQCFVEHSDRVGSLFVEAKAKLSNPSAKDSNPPATAGIATLVSDGTYAAGVRVNPSETKPPSGPTKRELMDAMAEALSPAGHSLEAERREHLYLFNLLGDPLLTIRQPAPLEFVMPESLIAGQDVTIRGSVKSPGKLQTELCYRRSRTPEKVRELRANQNVLDATQQQQAIYEAANRLEIELVTKEVSSGAFAIDLPTHSLRPGTYNVNVIWDDNQIWAVGNKTIRIEPAK